MFLKTRMIFLFVENLKKNSMKIDLNHVNIAKLY